MTDLTQLSPNSRRGYIAAREFLYSQCFLWAGATVGLLFYAVRDEYAEERFAEAAVLGILVALLYLPTVYVRALLHAWRVWRGKERPEEISEGEEQARAVAARTLIKQIGDNEG